MSARKYIIIPEYRPLYAMAKCFGPLHGPLMQPCPTPIDIIGKLLLQSGSEKLTIYEVKKDPDHTNKMLPPVLLTLDNYRLPYEEIANMKEDEPDISLTKVSDDTGTEVSPTFVKTPANDENVESINEVSNDSSENIETASDNTNETEETPAASDDTEITESDSEEPKAVEVKNESTPTTNNQDYTHMTRNQRREARRAAMEAAMKAKEEQKN